MIGAAATNLILVLIAYLNLSPTTLNDPFQMVEYLEWIPSLGISYCVGLDSISMMMIGLTSLVALFCFIGLNLALSPILGALYLFMQTGLYGTFLATDLFLFYFFWEIVLIPMLFIVGIWGGKERIEATLILLYLVYLFMLLAIIYLIVEFKNQTGGLSASYALLKNLNIGFDESSLETLFQSPKLYLFLAFTLAFIIKIPMVPFHTWQPFVYNEAPLPAAIFLSAVLAKMGTYGLLRFSIGLFPDVALFLSPWLMGLGILSIIYGAFCAWSQTEIKKFIAYSSISHSGYIVLGLFTLLLGMTVPL
jgi:NADH-quinone oxidoreductase subunit M